VSLQPRAGSNFLKTDKIFQQKKKSSNQEKKFESTKKTETGHSGCWRYFPNDTELALGMTLLEMNYVLQVFCVRQEDRGGVNWGS